MSLYARVITDNPTDKELDYLVPLELESKVQLGSRVKVPLRNGQSLGTVVAVSGESPVADPRSILRVLSDQPVFDEQLLELTRWLADYYCCSIETAIRSTLPQVIRRGEVGFKQERTVRLARTPSDQDLKQMEKRAPRQAEILRAVLDLSGTITWHDLVRDLATTDRTIHQLVQNGWLKVQARNADRDPHRNEIFVRVEPLLLNLEQTAALALVRQSVEARDSKPILLHGVTGSGKTEIYLQAIQTVLEGGGGALVLVPEISLTPQTVERFKSRFPSELIAVLHSHLSAGERHDEWHRIRSGSARVAIGARSAVFAPVHDLRLIVVDEEHELSYKQDEVPRYHARDLAIVRAQIARATILLGSATPALESYHNALTGKYKLLRLTTRIDDRKLPLIRIVDVRQELGKTRIHPLITRPLGAAIQERLDRGEQTILFLNRRGFATSLLCQKCGYLSECPNCSIPLTFHLSEDRLKCHFCGHMAVAPKKCPECGDQGIRYSGFGTEKIEGVVQKFFPDARIVRMDSDSMSRKGSYRETLTAFRAGKIDILIGTQMIAKGLDFPNVTLVGILNADIGLHLPDFRAGERTFQLLTQVAGRAGRGDLEGEVFVQTATPFSPSIQFARHHDFAGFWEQESEFRRKCDYPPYQHLVLVHVRSEHQRRAEFSAETVHLRLSKIIDRELVVLHPPVPAPLERAKGFFRFQILLWTKRVLQLSRQLKTLLNELTFPEDVYVGVDVDPYHLL